MNTVIAAVDNSAAATPVLKTARTLAARLGWRIRAVHAQEDGDAGARAAAAAAGIELLARHCTPAELVADVSSSPETTVVVLGARGFAPSGELGHTALELIQALHEPVDVVPPAAPPMQALDRILVPLDANATNADALARGLAILRASDVEVVILHVDFGASLPLFEDQPQHEIADWKAEFLRRYCPVAPARVRLELRTGRPGASILDVASEVDADLIALGWSQALEPGRALVVREVLERASLPVVLFPLEPGGR
jgi:nucleotide-binding universal stress UspA family protein